MDIAKIICLATLSALLAACVSPAPLQSLKPSHANNTDYVLARAPVLEQTNHVFQHLDKEKSVVYFQPFGGSLAAGVLFGALGAAANVAVVESNTMKDVAQLRDRIPLRPTEIFTEVARKSQLKLHANSEGKILGITPYLQVQKTEDASLLLSTVIIIEQNTGKEKWTGKYMFQLPVKYSIPELAQLNVDGASKLRLEVAQGFTKLVSYIQSESPEQLAQEEKIKFKSTFLSPQFDFEMDGALVSEESDVVWIRTFSGVYAIRKPFITWSTKKA